MKENHIIQKVFVEISVSNKEKALRIKDDIASFLSIEVFPEIEKYINALHHQFADHTLQIPKLELNVDVTSSELNIELKDKIFRIFKEQLSEITDSFFNSEHTIFYSEQQTDHNAEAYLVENEEKTVQTFIYFLTTGSMPWWNSAAGSVSFFEPQIFERLMSSDHFQRNIQSLFLKQNVKSRIVNQLSDGQIAKVCRTVLKNKEIEINLEKNSIRLISRLDNSSRNLIWDLVLNTISESLRSSHRVQKNHLLQQIAEKALERPSLFEKTQEIWKTLFEIFPFMKEAEVFERIENSRKVISESVLISKEETEQEKTEQKNTVIPDVSKKTEGYLNQKTDDLILNDDLYIQNAGLILIHPFLKTFFEHCDLFDSENNQLLNPELCAHLLHYIATGKTNAPEYDMVFEKFLCNIPLHQTISRHIKLSQNHKIQAKKVIESVQHNWSAMQKSSPALVQNEFFQRPGKLVIGHDYTLTVERKTQDILLEKIGWGIGFVKLPWLEKFIFINW